MLQQADVLASDLETSARKYSDIDLIFEKKTKQRAAMNNEVLNDK